MIRGQVVSDLVNRLFAKLGRGAQIFETTILEKTNNVIGTVNAYGPLEDFCDFRVGNLGQQEVFKKQEEVGSASRKAEMTALSGQPDRVGETTDHCCCLQRVVNSVWDSLNARKKEVAPSNQLSLSKFRSTMPMLLGLRLESTVFKDVLLLRCPCQ
jgi:hypothetical protein